MINVACGDLARTAKGFNQGYLLLTVGVICLLDLVRRGAEGGGS